MTLLVSADLGLYGGFIVISGGTSTLRVPYFGLKGSYQALNPVQYVSFGYDSTGTSVRSGDGRVRAEAVS